MDKGDYDFLKDNIDRGIDTQKRRYDEIRKENGYFVGRLAGQHEVMALRIKSIFSIKRVIFSNPATIVYWEDGSKTVVKADNEPFDPEKGLAMAITKKALGNRGNYFNEIRKWVDGYKGDFSHE